jgi:prepilin-type N-terminal cleavage/methylation domain-containing protein/prepilin-type processing-associated H-X9-DG protein
MKRAAFSLVELLICIAIMAVLVALLLPAVQSSRETGRRLRCASNMRQLALAMHKFEGAHGAFPPLANEEGNWQVLLMTYVEGGHRITVIRPPGEANWLNPPKYPPSPSILHCPSDPSANRTPSGNNDAVTSYLGNAGTGFRWYGYNGVFSPWPDGSAPTRPPNLAGPGVGKVSAATIQDGLSNTAALAEILVGDGSMHLRRVHWQLRGNYQEAHDLEVLAEVCTNHAFRVDPSGNPVGTNARGRPWWEPGHGRSLYNHIVGPNKPSCIGLNGSVLFGAYTPAALHPGGVQVAFADGHLQTVARSIDVTVWRALGSRDGDESIGVFP